LPKITLTVKTQFWDIQVSGDDPQELISGLEWLTLRGSAEREGSGPYQTALDASRI
jgi:hypothetical protein